MINYQVVHPKARSYTTKGELSHTRIEERLIHKHVANQNPDAFDKKDRLHVGFLFASPLILTNVRKFQNRVI